MYIKEPPILANLLYRRRILISVSFLPQWQHTPIYPSLRTGTSNQQRRHQQPSITIESKISIIKSQNINKSLNTISRLTVSSKTWTQFVTEQRVVAWITSQWSLCYPQQVYSWKSELNKFVCFILILVLPKFCRSFQPLMLHGLFIQKTPL